MSEQTDPAGIQRLLLERGLTVAVAESLTGGLLSAALTEPAGASGTFRGGLIVYATDLKAVLAGVPRALLDAQGPVSADVASALARGVRQRLSADLGIGITGVAGPDSVGQHPAGTVFVAVAGDGVGDVTRMDLAGSRAQIRAAAVQAAISQLASVLRAGAGIPGLSSRVTP
ncbi:MAG: CinA family protein [Actinomycetota bacterium]|nr:CinA family protein [Actinomycetota bacterium]